MRYITKIIEKHSEMDTDSLVKHQLVKIHSRKDLGERVSLNLNFFKAANVYKIFSEIAHVFGLNPPNNRNTGNGKGLIELVIVTLLNNPALLALVLEQAGVKAIPERVSQWESATGDKTP